MNRLITACRQVDQVQSRLVGYQVTCDCHGQYTSLMAQNPGRYVPVRVSAEPGVGR